MTPLFTPEVRDGDAIGVTVHAVTSLVLGMSSSALASAAGEERAHHVITNFRLHATNGSEASLGCILLLYAADGAPVLPSLPAILIADVRSDFVCGADGQYLFQSHVLSPVFMGGEAPTVPTKLASHSPR